MIYLDNAATTKMLPEVVEVMQQSMMSIYGNPSSIHQTGRKAKSVIETARKNIAKHFNVTASEIIFTSSGTEADNIVLHNAVVNLQVKHIVTTKIEHHAVLKTVEMLQKSYNIDISYVEIDERGSVDLINLEDILQKSNEKTLVSLMMINNEIGNFLPVDQVCEICEKHDVLFHSDTVQAIGHYKLDLQKTPIDFITASAHKFHGPKGVGFLYVKKGIPISSMFYGGEQEKGVRPSTENVHAVLGMREAINVAHQNLQQDRKHQTELKEFFISELMKISKDIKFNGLSSDLEKSSYAILNVRFPFKNNMFLFNLDLQGISASGGSACQSGSDKGSHVLRAILNSDEQLKASARFSFSKFTTKQEIESIIKILTRFFEK